MDNNNSNSDSNIELIGWLDIYHSSSDEEEKARVKNNIVLKMDPIVKYIARTIARRSTDPIEDMVQAGFIGLLKAIENYSKEKNDNFKVYAGYRIIGEMRHYLRDKLNSIRVPRYIQELSIRINNFTRTLTPEELSALTSDEVASALQVSKRTVDIAMQVERRGQTLSLDAVFQIDNDNLGYEEIISTNGLKDFTDSTDAKIIMKDVMEKLPHEARLLIDMFYNRGLSQKEISKMLNISQMNISRKMKKIHKLVYEVVENNKTFEMFEEIDVD